MNWIIPERDDDFEGGRIDRVLSELLEDVSRSQVQKAIAGQRVLVNGHPVKAKTQVKGGDHIFIDDRAFDLQPILPERVPLDVLYEDEYLLVINKPAGMIVHPTASVRSGTLVNALLAREHALSAVNGSERPGIVHRLDSDTTGALIVAKNDETHVALQRQFQTHEVEKHYYALCEGTLDVDHFPVDQPIGRSDSDRKKMAVRADGRPAKSVLTTLSYNEKASLLDVRIQTGRTHQIRVHMAFVKHPVIGDRLYGFHKQWFRVAHQLLHAHSLRFVHPKTHCVIECIAPIDAVFQDALNRLQLTL
ncbi:MAG: RluA family pseudouridine synthase [Ndongobacter sp.]|nr:RluA family pseudouridine synthase [Ndongobacter sp.]